MLQRGKPTLPSRYLRREFGLQDTKTTFGDEPKVLIDQEPINWSRLIRGDQVRDLYPAKHFFDNLVPKYFGEYAYVRQLMLPEVPIYDMTQVYVQSLNNKQVDFFIPQVGLIIEIDGQQHQHSRDLDKKRDEFTTSLGLRTVRFTTQEIASENAGFQTKIQQLIFYLREVDELERNGTLIPPNNITLEQYKDAFEGGIDTASPEIALTSAIRFQLLLLELLESGRIKFGEVAKIALINRDGVNFCPQAIEDLRRHFSHLFNLMNEPARELLIEVEEYGDLGQSIGASEIIVDFSILKRFSDDFQIHPNVVFVRTHYMDFYRQFTSGSANSISAFELVDYDYFEMSCTKPITYNLDLSPDSSHRISLLYFLENLFLPLMDDVSFREGQVGIIGSALARKGTVGLLPTGSGKSICYQLAAILQPAISFVVCPIKSLMYDQKADLDTIGITRTNFITGDQKPHEKSHILPRLN